MFAQPQQKRIITDRGGTLGPARLARYKSLLFLLFVAGASLAFAVIPAATRLSAEANLIGQAIISAGFLIVTLLLHRAPATRALAPVFFAFFVGAFAVLVSLLFGADLRQWFGYSLTEASGVALAKLSQCMLRSLPILLLLGLTAKGRESLYLVRGRLGLGLSVGAIAFVAFGALAFVPLAGDVPALRQVLSRTPWVLLFIFANAFEEELLFRGLFLKRYEPFLGKGLATLATAIVFTLAHVQVTYAADLVQFLLIVFPLGLAFAYLMQKSDGIWGSVLFHAGADLLLIVPFFATL